MSSARFARLANSSLPVRYARREFYGGGGADGEIKRGEGRRAFDNFFGAAVIFLFLSPFFEPFHLAFCYWLDGVTRRFISYRRYYF